MKKCFTLLSLFGTLSLFALPSGGQVVKGDARIAHVRNGLEIQASGMAIIQWDQFDIGPQEKIVFRQTELGTVILDCMTQDSASQILGRIESNCPVYLFNPQGVLVGEQALLDIGGFLASTAHISSEMLWQNSNLSFEQLGPGKIVNLGNIVSNGGDIFLVAGSIENAGKIAAPQGVVKITTSEVMIDLMTKQTSFIRLSENEQGIENTGTIQALVVQLKTGSPYEKAIHHDGSIEALTTRGQKGHISLVAEQGGVIVEGQLIANAEIDGDGGEITISTKAPLIFNGKAQARGGTQGGNGGTIHLCFEGSSSKFSEEHPIVDASAPCGKTGRVIFDPQYVNISPEGTDPATGNTFGSSPTDSVIISGATLQSALNAANVTIQANTDILFQDDVEVSTAGNGLTLQAGRSILFYGYLSLNGGSFIASINDDGAIAADRDPGVASFQFGNFSEIFTNGGDITVSVGNFGGVQEGEISIQFGMMDAGGGNVSMTGFARQDGSDDVYGISTGSYCVVQTSGEGSLSLVGTGGNGSNSNVGIYLLSSETFLQTDAGPLSLDGYGGGNGTGSGNMGIYSSATLNILSTGTVTFNGFAGSGIDNNMGIYMSDGVINTVDGDINLTGIGMGTGEQNMGVSLATLFESLCQSTGSGVITLSGTSGNGTNNNHGVSLSGTSLIANNGAISITGVGQGSEDFNYGIRIETTGQCLSTGTAPITLQGNNLSGLNGNCGVIISSAGPAIVSSNGNIQMIGISNGTMDLNQGIRIEMGEIQSTGTGSEAAQISLVGTGGPGTDDCNGVVVQSVYSEVTSIDGNIIIEGTARGNGQNNQPILVIPSTQVNTTGSGTVTFIPH